LEHGHALKFKSGIQKVVQFRSVRIQHDLPLDCLQLPIGHDLRVAGHAYPADLRDARSTVGFEYEAEQPGHDVVEFLAVAGIRVIDTACARRAALPDAARAHLAPGRLRVLMATPALAARIRPAGAAIKTAVSDQFRPCFKLRHVESSSGENPDFNIPDGNANGLRWPIVLPMSPAHLLPGLPLADPERYCVQHFPCQEDIARTHFIGPP
jgi:hypothetical protein